MKETFRGAWGKIKEFDLDKVTDLIVTGRKPEEATPDSWLYEWFKDDGDKSLTVMDFGCGMGRNTFGVANHFKNWTVIGYDSEAMIGKTKDYAAIHYKDGTPSNTRFVTNWDELKMQKFDKIFCMLVLQHIFEDDLVKYAQDFKTMTKFLLVAGRRFNDGPKRRSTWKVLEEQGLTPSKFFAGHVEIPFEPDGEPEAHNIAFYYP
jgi:SAM-dependent methyltransferase